MSCAAKQSQAASRAAGEKLIGALSRKVALRPGATAKVTFVLSWHFPNLKFKGVAVAGRHYAARFESAGAVARYVAANYQRLARETRLWRDTWYDSTLPFWFLDRTFLNTSILATSTCHRFSDGRFYDVRKDEWFKKAPLADRDLDDKAKAVKAKLQGALKAYDWPRDDYFIKQYSPETEK